MAGTSHADRTFLDEVVANANRDSIPTAPPGLCDFPEGSEVRFYHVGNAAYDHMVRWVDDGTPPGTVLGTHDGALRIAARGGRIGVAKIQVGNAAKCPAADAGIAQGAVLT